MDNFTADELEVLNWAEGYVDGFVNNDVTNELSAQELADIAWAEFCVEGLEEKNKVRPRTIHDWKPWEQAAVHCFHFSR